MSDERELQWAPIPPKPSNRRRIWLIVGLVVATVLVVGVLLFLLIPRGESSGPGATASPSSSPSGSPSPSTSSAPPAEPEPPTTPVETPPAAADPTVEAFRGEVQVWLDNSLEGLDIVGETSGQETLSVIETLLADAQRLGERPAPSSIEGEWYAGVSSYVEELNALKSAASEGANTDSAVESARAAAQALRSLVGL